MPTQRLVNHHRDAFTRALLASAERDVPSAGAYARVASALGVSLGVSTTALTASAATSMSTASGGSVSTLLMVKAILIGAVSGLSVVGGAAYALHAGWVGSNVVAAAAAPVQRAPGPLVARPAPLSAARAPAVVAPEPAAEEPALVAQAEPAETVTLDLDAPRAAPAKRRHARRHSVRAGARGVLSAASAERRSEGASPAPVDSSLPEQVASLDRARVALAAGQPQAALHELDRYQRAWPKGVFVSEARVLQIEALLKRGERARALDLARDFVASYPANPHTERLRALLSSDGS